MRTMAAIDRPDGVPVSVVLEGLAAFLALVAVVGAVCGALTWGLVQLVSLVLS